MTSDNLVYFRRLKSGSTSSSVRRTLFSICVGLFNMYSLWCRQRKRTQRGPFRRGQSKRMCSSVFRSKQSGHKGEYVKFIRKSRLQERIILDLHRAKETSSERETTYPGKERSGRRWVNELAYSQEMFISSIQSLRTRERASSGETKKNGTRENVRLFIKKNIRMCCPQNSIIFKDRIRIINISEKVNVSIKCSFGHFLYYFTLKV